MSQKDKVIVIMGSTSDKDKVAPCIKLLKEFDIRVEAHCLSAHRTPERLATLIDGLETETKAIIAAAGMSAALPGVIASQTIIPVIGLPLSGSALTGKDALYAMVQMPSGYPVATVAIDGAKNAALLAVQIVATGNELIADQLTDYRDHLVGDVLEADKIINREYSTP